MEYAKMSHICVHTAYKGRIGEDSLLDYGHGKEYNSWRKYKDGKTIEVNNSCDTNKCTIP